MMRTKMRKYIGVFFVKVPFFILKKTRLFNVFVKIVSSLARRLPVSYPHRLTIFRPIKLCFHVRPRSRYRLVVQSNLTPASTYNVCLIQFSCFLESKKKGEFENAQFSLSEKIGYFKYLRCSDSEPGKIFIHFETPAECKDIQATIMRWNTKCQDDVEIFSEPVMEYLSDLPNFTQSSHLANVPQDRKFTCSDILALFKAGMFMECLEVLKISPESECQHPDLKCMSATIAEWMSLREIEHWMPKTHTYRVLFENNAETKVLMVLHESYPYSNSEYSIRSHLLLKSIQERQGAVKVFALTNSGALALGYVKSIGDAFEGVCDGVLYTHLQRPSMNVFSTIRYFQARAKQIVSEAIVRKTTVIHATNNFFNAIPALMAARNLGLPFIYEMRDLDYLTKILEKPGYDKTTRCALETQMERLIISRANHLIVYSEAMKQFVLSCGVTQDAVTVSQIAADIPKPIDDPRRDFVSKDILPFPRQPTIGYVGKLANFEGIKLLFEASAQLLRKGHKINILVLGEGEARKSLQRRSEELGIRMYLIMPEEVDREAYEAYCKLIDICVYPRLRVNGADLISPIGPIESLARAKAVVCSDLEIFKEVIVDEYNGLLFENGNVASLAERMKYLLDRPDIVETLGATGREWVEQNKSWRQVAKSVEDAYRKVTSFSKEVGEWKRIAVVTDIDPSYVDGPSVWLSTVTEALLADESNIVFLFLTKKLREQTTLSRVLDDQRLIVIDDFSRTDATLRQRENELIETLAVFDQIVSFEAILVTGNEVLAEFSGFDHLVQRAIAYVFPPSTLVYRSYDHQKRLLARSLYKFPVVACPTELVKDFARSLGAIRQKTSLLPPIFCPVVEMEVLNTKSIAEGEFGPLKVVYAGLFSSYWAAKEMLQLFSAQGEKLNCELHILGDKVQAVEGDMSYEQAIGQHVICSSNIHCHDECVNELAEEGYRFADIGWAWCKDASMIDEIEMSTKVLEYASQLVPPIVNRAPITERMLGAEYPLFADSMEEIFALLQSIQCDRTIVTMAQRAIKEFCEIDSFEMAKKRLKILFGSIFSRGKIEAFSSCGNSASSQDRKSKNGPAENCRKTRIALTVDVEAQPHRAERDPLDRLIWGRFGGDDDFGVGRLMDLADENGLKLICFLDYCEYALYGDGLLDVAREIDRRGHDVQIHAHLEYLPRAFASDHGLKKIGNMDQLDFECARCLVDYLMGLAERATGKKAIAFRGGAFRFNPRLIDSLSKAGVTVSSNYCSNAKYWRIQRPHATMFRWPNGMLELPLSDVHIEGKFRQLVFEDYEVDSFEELRQFVEQYDALSKQECILNHVFHSWSLLSRQTEQSFDYPSEEKVRKAKEFFSNLNRLQIESVTCKDIQNIARSSNVPEVTFDEVFIDPTPDEPDYYYFCDTLENRKTRLENANCCR